MYHSFNPDWLPEDHRELKMLVDKRLREIGERYGDDFEDVDVINELYKKYKNLYGEERVGVEERHNRLPPSHQCRLWIEN